MTILETAVLELKNYIDGKWQTSSSYEVIPVINPATQEVIARAPRATKGRYRKCNLSSENSF